MKHVGMALVFSLLSTGASLHGSSATLISAQSTPATTPPADYRSLIITAESEIQKTIRAALKELPADIVNKFIDNRDSTIPLRTAADVLNALAEFADNNDVVVAHHCNAATNLV